MFYKFNTGEMPTRFACAKGLQIGYSAL